MTEISVFNNIGLWLYKDEDFKLFLNNFGISDEDIDIMSIWEIRDALEEKGVYTIIIEDDIIWEFRFTLLKNDNTKYDPGCNYSICIPVLESTELFKSPYRIKDDIINEFKTRFGNIFPDNYNYDDVIGRIEFLEVNEN